LLMWSWPWRWWGGMSSSAGKIGRPVNGTNSYGSMIGRISSKEDCTSSSDSGSGAQKLQQLQWFERLI
jgi:hypothetical protein